MRSVAILYHGGCDDGSTAWYIVQEAICDVRMTRCAGLQPNQEIPEWAFECDSIVLLDLCMPRKTLENMLQRHAHVVVLDHHAPTREHTLNLGFEAADD